MEKPFALIFLAINLTARPVYGAEIEVCARCPVPTLSQALERAQAGDTLLLHSETFTGSDLLIPKPLTIKAKDPTHTRPVLDIEGKGNGLIVQAENVHISGLKIINSGYNYTQELAAIKLLESRNSIIENNWLENNAFGIYGARAESGKILNNTVIGTGYSESRSGNGVHLWNCKQFLIKDNQLSHNRDGIYFEFVTDTLIQRNESRQNLRYGLHFMYSHQNQYRENRFIKNDSGVAVMYSRQVQMVRNHFEHNHGSASYGLLLKDISESQILENTLIDNTTGVFMDNTTRTRFESNTFAHNGWALRALGNNDTNEITLNRFSGNTFDIVTNASRNQNKIWKNYWSRYPGLDLNHDGIGDTPYYPVQLTSLLTEKYPTSILLLHSLFFSLLDQIESLLPILTPESYKDPEPLIVPVNTP